MKSDVIDVCCQTRFLLGSTVILWSGENDFQMFL